MRLYRKKMQVKRSDRNGNIEKKTPSLEAVKFSWQELVLRYYTFRTDTIFLQWRDP